MLWLVLGTKTIWLGLRKHFFCLKKRPTCFVSQQKGLEMCVYVRCPNLLIQPFLTVTSQIVLHNLMKIFFSLSKVYTNTLLVYYCRFKKLRVEVHMSHTTKQTASQIISICWNNSNLKHF